MDNADGYLIWILLCFSPLIIVSVLDMHHDYKCFVSKIFLKIDLYRISKNQYFELLDKNDLEEIEKIKDKIISFDDFPSYEWSYEQVILWRIKNKLHSIKKDKAA